MFKFFSRLRRSTPDSNTAKRRPRLVIAEDRYTDIFAIGDIHGCLDVLLDAEERVSKRMQALGRPALIICTGDFVDRGPDSSGVIDHLIAKMPANCDRISLCGNHDDAFFKFITTDRYNPDWLEFAGDTTLMSYGIDARGLMSIDPSGRRLKDAVRVQVPAEHIAFLASLPIALSIGNYLFVHAGVAPGIPLAQQADADLMWIREPFLAKGPCLDLTVIHGHTPTASVDYGRHRVGIDTRAYATGRLSVLHIEPGGVAEI